jgi:WS/DGAT/MGAT family acyltransferase
MADTSVAPAPPPVRDTDVFTWRMERDPLLRSTIVAVTLFDAAPDWEVLCSRVERASRLTPTFRQRLAPTTLPFGLGRPQWVTDRDFDLTWHLRRQALPSPGAVDQVLDVARVAGMAAFDPARPLWQFTLVEGIEGGRAALVLKIHHALTDGIGGIDLAAHVVDLQREPTDLGPLPPVPSTTAGDGGDVVAAARAEALRLVSGVAGQVAATPRRAWSFVRDPVGTVGGVVATARSVARFVEPVTTTLSPVMVDRRLAWRYAALDVPFEPLHAAAAALGYTLNDAFVASVTGGLRRYHEHHGATVEQLRMTMPISVRGDDDPMAGNRVTLVRFPVPVAEPDPARRMAAVDGACRAWRVEPAIPHSEAVAAVLNLLPAAVTGSMLKHVDILCSNVPGFGDPVYVGGARVEGFWAFGPTIGAAANLTLMSYDGRCCVGVNTDAGAVPDPDEFVRCLREGFDEVLDLAGDHAPVVDRGASWRA